MSIILKGIDLPEDGGTIVLKIKGSKIYQEYPSRYKFQPTQIKDAKAIQISKNHGRLIDADVLQREAYQKNFDGIIGNWALFQLNYYLEEKAQTILEAEE